MPLPGRFIPGKETGYTLYRRRCGTLGRSKRVWKSTLLEFDPRTVFEAFRRSNLIYILFSSQKGIIGLLQNIFILLKRTFQITCSVDPSSLYNPVNETNFVYDFLLVDFANFIYNFYMFRTSPLPSSAGITIFIWHFLFVIFYLTVWYAGWNTRLSAKQNNNYQVSHKYSCSFYLIFMDLCIVIWINRNNYQDAAL